MSLVDDKLNFNNVNQLAMLQAFDLERTKKYLMKLIEGVCYLNVNNGEEQRSKMDKVIEVAKSAMMMMKQQKER